MQDEIVTTFPPDKIALTQPMIHYLLEGLIRNHEVDRAILLFRDIRARKIQPRNRTYHLMITICAQNLEPEEAFNILMEFKEICGVSQIPERMWWTVLHVCAQEGFVSPAYSVSILTVGTRNVTLLAIYPEYTKRSNTRRTMSPSPLRGRA